MNELGGLGDVGHYSKGCLLLQDLERIGLSVVFFTQEEAIDLAVYDLAEMGFQMIWAFGNWECDSWNVMMKTVT